MNPKSLRLLSLNLAYQMPQNRPFLGPWVRVWKPDLMVLVEAFPEDVGRLADVFPHRFGYQDHQKIGIGTEIFSRFPIRSGSVQDPARDIPLVMARVETPWGDLEIWGVHLRPTIPNRRPDRVIRSFFQRQAQIRLLKKQGGMGGLPALLVGDFNLTPRMPEMAPFHRRYRHAHREMGALKPTYRYFLPLTLDHMFYRGVTPGAAMTVRAPFSDHDGLLLDFTLDGATSTPG